VTRSGEGPPPVSARGLWIVVALVVVALAFFLDKAYTIDDTLFLWLGKHIQEDPIDFYGFVVNWYGTEQPMHEVTKNPPLVGYFIALAALLFGFGEKALHAAFLLPAAAAAAGTCLLARRFCGRPLLASIAGLATPVFLVSSTTVMCDTTMLAFFVWAIHLWVRGVDSGEAWLLVAAAALAALAGLAKYFGVAAVPLMAAYALLRTRGVRVRWVLPLLLPVAVMAAYQLATKSLYGKGLLLDAAEYASLASSTDGSSRFPANLVGGFVFAGGCLAPALFFAPLLWPRSALAAGGAVLAAGMAAALFSGTLPGVVIPEREDSPASFALHALLMALAGASAVALAAADVARRRDADAALLALWLAGTFFFAAFLNWVNNGRSNLPMAPVFGILLVRRLEARAVPPPPAWAQSLALSLGILLALAVAAADARWANDVRETARGIAARHVRPGAPVRFLGHWGFQWYMEEGGAKALDVLNEGIPAGTILVIPSNSTQLYYPERDEVVSLEVPVRPEPRVLRTMARKTGAGFYANNMGFLPYRILPGAEDVYFVLRAVKDFRIPVARPDR